jgi:hypothetical protein
MYLIPKVKLTIFCIWEGIVMNKKLVEFTRMVCLMIILGFGISQGGGGKVQTPAPTNLYELVKMWIPYFQDEKDSILLFYDGELKIELDSVRKYLPPESMTVKSSEKDFPSQAYLGFEIKMDTLWVTVCKATGCDRMVPYVWGAGNTMVPTGDMIVW